MGPTAPCLLEHDPERGITEYYHYDPHTHGFVIETRQDVTNLVEINKRLANDSTGRWRDLNLVASYPLTIWWDLKQRGILDDQKVYRRWLNDADNRVFRCKLGRV